ncbi:tetratricopeptide repeat protein [bacterium]|nr:tetratricopeptide repeat protein [bacterium]
MKFYKIIICLSFACVIGCAQIHSGKTVFSSVSPAEQKKMEEKLLRDPTNQELRKILIVNYIQTQQYDKARHELAKILSKNADDIDANYYMGLVYSRGNLLNEAVIYYNKVLELKPDHIPALFNLASIQLKNRNPSSAVRLYNKILEIDPDDAETHYNLAFIYDNYFIQEENALRQYKLCLELLAKEKSDKIDLNVIRDRIKELKLLKGSK